MGRSKVPNDDPQRGQPFSVETIKQLAEVMTKHDLSEVDLDTDTGRLRLRRGRAGQAGGGREAIQVVARNQERGARHLLLTAQSGVRALRQGRLEGQSEDGGRPDRGDEDV